MKKGFTLIEIMVVVVIAVTVAAFAVPAYKKSQQRNQFLAAEGKLLEISSGLRNVMQMYKGTSCTAGQASESDKNDDGTLNEKGCKYAPHICVFTNKFTKAKLEDAYNYSYSITTDCKVCMTGGFGTESAVPSQVCVDKNGCEELTYSNGTYQVNCPN